MTSEEIVLIDSDKAAKLTVVEGWVSRDGLFYGKNESGARWAGCTHKYCESCGSVMPKHGWTICPSCRERKSAEKYATMPRLTWDGDTPLYSDAADEYFFDEDSLRDFIFDRDCTAESLRLIVCEPNRYRRIENDYFCDELPEDGDLPPALEDALCALNEVIDQLAPASWSPGKYAAIYNSEPHNQSERGDEG